MNISITPALAGYVKQKVESGPYKNASEVVREALRMMENQEIRDLRLAGTQCGGFDGGSLSNRVGRDPEPCSFRDRGYK